MMTYGRVTSTRWDLDFTVQALCEQAESGVRAGGLPIIRPDHE